MESRIASPIRLLVVDEAIAPGGVERLWLSLLPELARLCERLVWMVPDHQLLRFRDAIPPTSTIQFEPLHTGGWKDGDAMDLLGRRLSKWLPSRLSWAVERYLENRRLRTLCRQHRITHLLYPALFRQPFPETVLPVLAAVMDVNYYPSWRDECLRNLAVWADRANSLISISEFTRDEIVQLFPDAAEKVKAITISSDGPSAEARRGPDRDSSEGIGCPTFYYPAGFNPHKGHAILLAALRLLHDEGLQFRLLLTGGGTEQLSATTPNAIHELEQARQVLAHGPEAFRCKVEILGIVTADAVEDCFQAADLIVLPTRYEGFGLPLAEAVARGKLALCSDIPAFREQLRIYGYEKAVTFVPEATAEAWKETIRRAVTARELAPYGAEELRSIFARRTWNTVARDYLQALITA